MHVTIVRSSSIAHELNLTLYNMGIVHIGDSHIGYRMVKRVMNDNEVWEWLENCTEA